MSASQNQLSPTPICDQTKIPALLYFGNGFHSGYGMRVGISFHFSQRCVRRAQIQSMSFSASCEAVPFVAVVSLPFFHIFFFQNSGR